MALNLASSSQQAVNSSRIRRSRLPRALLRCLLRESLVHIYAREKNPYLARVDFLKPRHKALTLFNVVPSCYGASKTSTHQAAQITKDEQHQRRARLSNQTEIFPRNKGLIARENLAKAVNSHLNLLTVCREYLVITQ